MKLVTRTARTIVQSQLPAAFGGGQLGLEAGAAFALAVKLIHPRDKLVGVCQINIPKD